MKHVFTRVELSAVAAMLAAAAVAGGTNEVEEAAAPEATECVIVRLGDGTELPSWDVSLGKGLIVEHSGVTGSVAYAEQFDCDGRLVRFGPVSDFSELTRSEPPAEIVVTPVETLDPPPVSGREEKVRNEVRDWNAKVDGKMAELLGLRFGMRTDELTRVKGRVYRLPRRFLKYETVLCHDVGGVVYEFVLQCPFGGDCPSVTVTDEAMKVKTALAEKLGCRLEWGRCEAGNGRKTVTCGWRMDVRFTDPVLKSGLENSHKAD